MNVRRFSLLLTLVSVLAACAGGVSTLTPGPIAQFVPALSTISVTPKKLNIAQGTSATVAVSEANYTGIFKATTSGTTSCKGKATFTPAQGRGPKLKVKIKGVLPASCTIAFTDAAKHTVKLPVKVLAVPLDYVYVVSYYASTVAQFVVTSDGKMSPLAAPYQLPSSCTGPDAITLTPSDKLAFVTCYISGSVVPIGVNAQHQLVSTPLAPEPAPSPVYAVAPATGTANMLYVDGGASLTAFNYSATMLSTLGTYATGSYPDKMTFYTDAQGHSTLYVSAIDNVTCTNSYSNGAIEPWAQSTNGTLTEQSLLPVCATSYNVVAQGGALLWAGPTKWGAFDLTTKAPLTLASPPWASTKGPGYNPDATNPVTPVSPPPGATAPHTDFGDVVSISAGDGNIYLESYSNGQFTTIQKIPLASGIPSGAGNCTVFQPPLMWFGFIKHVNYFCWAFKGDYLVFYVITGTGPQPLSSINIGGAPAGMTMRAVPAGSR